MSTIAVTGATGFLGRAVVQALESSENRVVQLGRQENRDIGLPFHRVDLLESSGLIDAFESERPEQLVHLAWDVTHRQYWHSDLNRQWSEATLRLAQTFASAGGRRLVVAGTCAERATNLSSTPYAVAKARTREILITQTELEVVWIRVFFPIGPYEDPRRLIPSLIRALASGDRFFVREPSLVRDFCSVTDVGCAFAAAVRGSQVGTYDVGTGIGYSLGDVAQQVAEVMNRPGTIDFGPPSAPNPLIASTGGLAADFGWDAMISPHDALGQAVNWWKDRM